jgi:hypothetical protein
VIENKSAILPSVLTMKTFTKLTFVVLLLIVSVSLSSAKRAKKVRTDNDGTLEKIPGDKPTSLDTDGSGDYDDDYDYDDDENDVSSGSVAKTVDKDEDSLEKIVEEEKELDVDDDDDDDDDDDISTTTMSTNGSTVKDDIHFVEDDDNEVPIEQEKPKVRKVNVDKSSNAKKEDLLYEYYSEYFDEDYDDLNENGDTTDKKSTTKLPPIVATSTPKTVVDTLDDEDSTETEKSAIFPPSYIFLIIASALVSFTVFMLAFLVCRRTVAQRRQKKLMPFVVSASTYGPPSLSNGLKSSGPIVKNYQRVPTSTKEFLMQQQQQQLVEQLQGETKQPLLT